MGRWLRRDTAEQLQDQFLPKGKTTLQKSTAALYLTPEQQRGDTVEAFVLGAVLESQEVPGPGSQKQNSNVISTVCVCKIKLHPTKCKVNDYLAAVVDLNAARFGMQQLMLQATMKIENALYVQIIIIIKAGFNNVVNVLQNN